MADDGWLMAQTKTLNERGIRTYRPYILGPCVGRRGESRREIYALDNGGGHITWPPSYYDRDTAIIERPTP